MKTVLNLFRNLWNSIACIGELLGYLLRFVSVFFQSRTSLAARLVAAWPRTPRRSNRSTFRRNAW